MTTATIFRGGLPYGPDVNRLKERFPVESLQEGLIISHQDIESVIQQRRGTSRYYGVVESWIRDLRNTTGIFIVWEPQTGIKILDPAGVLGFAEKRTRQKLRQTGRTMKLFGSVDRARLDGVGQQRLDHQLRVVRVLAEAIDKSKKELVVDLAPVQSLPRPRLAKREEVQAK